MVGFFGFDFASSFWAACSVLTCLEIKVWTRELLMVLTAKGFCKLNFWRQYFKDLQSQIPAITCLTSVLFDLHLLAEPIFGNWCHWPIICHFSSWVPSCPMRRVCFLVYCYLPQRHCILGEKWPVEQGFSTRAAWENHLGTLQNIATICLTSSFPQLQGILS